MKVVQLVTASKLAGRIAQHIVKRKGRKEGKDEDSVLSCHSNKHVQSIEVLLIYDKKCKFGPGFEPGSRALRASALTY